MVGSVLCLGSGVVRCGLGGGITKFPSGVFFSFLGCCFGASAVAAAAGTSGALLVSCVDGMLRLSVSLGCDN